MEDIVKITRKGLINARNTFGPVKYGKPSGKKIKLAIPEMPAPKITKENWLFMTGTLWKDQKLCKCKGKCNERKGPNT